MSATATPYPLAVFFGVLASAGISLVLAGGTEPDQFFPRRDHGQFDRTLVPSRSMSCSIQSQSAPDQTKTDSCVEEEGGPTIHD